MIDWTVNNQYSMPHLSMNNQIHMARDSIRLRGCGGILAIEGQPTTLAIFFGIFKECLEQSTLPFDLFVGHHSLLGVNALNLGIAPFLYLSHGKHARVLMILASNKSGIYDIHVCHIVGWLLYIPICTYALAPLLLDWLLLERGLVGESYLIGVYNLRVVLGLKAMGNTQFIGAIGI